MVVEVRAGSMQGYTALMRSLGHDPAPLLARCQLSEALLADEDTRVPLQHAFDLIRVGVEVSGRTDLGLLAAQHQDIGMLGPLALAMQNAPTVDASITYLTRYLCVQSPALVMRLHRPSTLAPDAVELRYDPGTQAGLHAVPQVLDHGLALAHLTLRALAGPRYALQAVSLPGVRADGLLAHRRFFGAPVRPEQPAGALHFATSMLAAPIDAARPALLRVAAEYLERRAPAAATRLDERVRRVLTDALGQTLLGKAAVAELLGLHPRTLQRRLDAEGTRFETLRDEVRREASLRYLGNTQYSLAQIAGLVGFSEQSAFTRFCRQRFGDTPRALRAAAVARAGGRGHGRSGTAA